MKELKVKYWDDVFTDIICFEADWLQLEYTFIENKNFEPKPTTLPMQRHYLELDYKCLNLKQFKMEII